MLTQLVQLEPRVRAALNYVIVMAQPSPRHIEKRAMKVIGLIGGMSWNSTLEYYRITNESFARRLGGLHSARLVLYNLDFDEIQRAQHEDRWDDIASILVDAGNALKRAGADFLLICTNTMHKVADDVEHRVGLPLLHMVDVIGAAVKEREMHRIGLLGTRFLVEGHLYQDRLRDRFAIEVLAPGEEDIDTMHQIIYNELCAGKIKASSRRICADVISRLVNNGAEGIVLGCTELPLLIHANDTHAPIFDTTRLHAEAAVTLALVKG
jgi:aspartate racemase